MESFHLSCVTLLQTLTNVIAHHSYFLVCGRPSDDYMGVYIFWLAPFFAGNGCPPACGQPWFRLDNAYLYIPASLCGNLCLCVDLAS